MEAASATALLASSVRLWRARWFVPPELAGRGESGRACGAGSRGGVAAAAGESPGRAGHAGGDGAVGIDGAWVPRGPAMPARIALHQSSTCGTARSLSRPRWVASWGRGASVDGGALAGLLSLAHVSCGLPAEVEGPLHNDNTKHVVSGQQRAGRDEVGLHGLHSGHLAQPHPSGHLLRVPRLVVQQKLAPNNHISVVPPGGGCRPARGGEATAAVLPGLRRRNRDCRTQSARAARKQRFTRSLGPRSRG